MRNVLTLLLAGGAGERLHPLTRNRAKPAVHFGGIYRIIDFTLSNCLNSGCCRIAVLVQYKSNSLVRHIRQAWDIFQSERGEFIDIVPPQMRVNQNWYLGTADAIFQNLYSIDQADPSEVLILSGDHIYKMDYKKKVNFHRQVEADLTISAFEVPIEEASQFGVLQIDDTSRIIGFEEKPENPKPIPGKPDRALASMGIYVFNPEVLRRVLTLDTSATKTAHDFGKDIIPHMLESHAVYAYAFQDENRKETQYWRDVGTLDSYWDANMDLVSVDPQFNLYDTHWPLRTGMPTLPPAKFVFGDPGERFGATVDSIVSPGCVVSGGLARRCVLGPEVRINSFAQVEDSIIFGGATIGRHSRIRRAIIEKGVHLPEHTTIGYNLEEDARHHRVTKQGIVVVEAPHGQGASSMPPLWPANR